MFENNALAIQWVPHGAVIKPRSKNHCFGPNLVDLFAAFVKKRGGFSLLSFEVGVRSTPHPLTVTTRIITFLVGNPYKPLFATVTGWGVDPKWEKPPPAAT